MSRRYSLGEVIAKLDAGDAEDARFILNHLRDKLIAEQAGPQTDRHYCPECGPHGNKGRVCLLLSWADCTMCVEATITTTP